MGVNSFYEGTYGVNGLKQIPQTCFLGLTPPHHFFLHLHPWFILSSISPFNFQVGVYHLSPTFPNDITSVSAQGSTFHEQSQWHMVKLYAPVPQRFDGIWDIPYPIFFPPQRCTGVWKKMGYTGISQKNIATSRSMFFFGIWEMKWNIPILICHIV